MPETTTRLSPAAIRTLARTTGPASLSTQNLTLTGSIMQPQAGVGPAGSAATLDPTKFEIPPLDTLRVIRADDLFNGIFRFHNMQRHPISALAVKADPDLPAYLTLDLPGQHVGEEVIRSDSFDASKLRARLAGRSRIAVRMPVGSPGAPISLAGLLGVLAEWPLSVDPLAAYASGGIPKQMLEAVADTFGRLAAELLLHLTNLGLASHALQASLIARRLADDVHAALARATVTNAQAISNTARATVEARTNQYGAQAADQISGNADRKREAAEAAESLVEVFFARRLAQNILADGGAFGIELLMMSGLFNLMMHPHPPGDVSTALELPYRLITSPGAFSRFAHRTQASGGARVEMWRTRLQPLQGLYPPEGIDFFAVWTPDYDLETGLMKNANGTEAPMSLNAEWRRNIVKRTSGHNEEPLNGAVGQYHDPKPAKVRRLELSPLGATLDLGVTWPNEAALFPAFGGLIGWEHRTALGRDERVRIAEAGVLYPFGIPCTRVTLTERLFRLSGGARWAPLRQKVFLLIDDAPRVFPIDGQPDAGRGMPFRMLRCTTLKTPEIDPAGRIGTLKAERVEVADRAFLFEFVATDDQGREVGFRLPQYFLPANYATTWTAERQATLAAWRAEGDRYKALLRGQTMRMAKATSANLDMGIARMAFGADHGTGGFFAPRMDWAEAKIPGVAEISGLPEVPRKITLTPNYLSGSFPGAGNRIVVKIEEPIALDFSAELTSDAMGALGQANQVIGAISDALGPVPLPDASQLTQMIRGDADWDDLLPRFKLLGKFLLDRLIDGLSDHGIELPSFRARRTEEEIIREWKLQRPITRSTDLAGVVLGPRDAGAEILLHAFAKATLKSLAIDGAHGGGIATLEVPTEIGNPAAEAHGRITNVDLTLFDIMKVRFDEIGFDAVAGRKPEARVLMNANPMEFYGPLEFLNGLKDLIPSTGHSHGPMINPLPRGVEARFDIGLPNLVMGVFALKNMTLGASTTIPFTDRPIELAFNFNERQRPFEIAVAGLGGGGFFAMHVDSGGVKEIEAALEFGASASLSIGVASGSVSIKGGVYFRHDSSLLIFEGYVELRGRLSVLELISASLVFHMALAYEKRGPKKCVRGSATLRVEVEVLFFSTSVTLHVERSFDTGDADPLFSDMTSHRDWIDHCDAFA